MCTELSIVNEIVLNFRYDSKTWNKCKCKKARKTFLGCTIISQMIGFSDFLSESFRHLVK